MWFGEEPTAEATRKDEAHYLGAVVPDGFVLQLTILFTVGETWEIRLKKERIKGKKEELLADML